METNQIKTIQDAERYCEGLVNDFQDGFIDKGEMMSELRNYTFHLHDMFKEQFEKQTEAQAS